MPLAVVILPSVTTLTGAVSTSAPVKSFSKPGNAVAFFPFNMPRCPKILGAAQIAAIRPPSAWHAMQAIGTLSGGEQAKVKMCLLTLTPCNFLIMDEPTNHLDVQAKDALKSALMDFNGTVLLVSHEEAFYRDWTQRIINIEKR